MKKTLMTLLAVFVVVASFIAGCGGGSPEPKKEKPAIPAKICTTAGIGDTMDEWIKDYGKPNRDNGLTQNFQKDDFIVLFGDDKRALNITIQAEDMKAPEEYVKKMVPKDGKLVSEKKANSSVGLTIDKEYTSESLKLAIKSNLTGHYSVSEIRNPKTKSIISYVIDCTPTLQEIQKSKDAK